MIRSRERRYHREWALRKWESALCGDWDYEYLLVHLRAKLETMERYNLHLSYAMNGTYYGHQIGRAIKMIDIILQKGGRSDYDEREDCTPVPESFKHYVNMRNRTRIPSAAAEGSTSGQMPSNSASTRLGCSSGRSSPSRVWPGEID